jgi:hypothetical protein
MEQQGLLRSGNSFSWPGTVAFAVLTILYLRTQQFYTKLRTTSRPDFKSIWGPGAVTCAYNPSCSRGGDPEGLSSRSAQGKKLVRRHFNKTSQSNVSTEIPATQETIGRVIKVWGQPMQKIQEPIWKIT